MRNHLGDFTIISRPLFKGRTHFKFCFLKSDIGIKETCSVHEPEMKEREIF